MSRDTCFCYEDDSVESAAELMEEKQIRRLAVFDRSQRPIGMVSLDDRRNSTTRRTDHERADFFDDRAVGEGVRYGRG